MTDELEGKRRVRASKTDDDVKPKLKEVRLIRKYVPHNCYEMRDERVVPVTDENGEFLRQDRVPVGEKTDRFGRKTTAYREVFDAWPAGTVIPLPKDEAIDVLEKGIATTTARSFD